jgi:GntR family transcriptional regulator / MocR family aminotransferase
MRKWELLTRTLDARRRSPLYLQLSNAFADDIRKGRLKPGEALPGTRVLAEQLGVHRTTVMSAYQELVAEGLARTRTGGGTFVRDDRRRRRRSRCRRRSRSGRSSCPTRAARS